MHTGTIISLVLDKGFGFIFEKTGEPDIFFHASELADDLPFDERLKEWRVQFDITDREGRWRATNVRAAG